MSAEIDLSHGQRVADIQRETATLIQDAHPDIALILISGAETIEIGLDLIKKLCKKV